MRRLAWIILGCLVAAAALFAGLRLRTKGKRARSIEQAAQQLGHRASDITDAVFWLVNADTSNLAIMASGRAPTFAEGAGGLATAIDEAGYFLTAAHAVYGNVHVFGKFGERWEARKATIVFQGNGANPADDFCILRVDERIPAALPLATTPGSSGDAFYAVIRNGSDRAVATGRIVRTPEAPANARATAIQTNVALNGGDSGGPVLNEIGEIIGVNSSLLRNRWLHSRSGLACCPARAFVETIIRQDKARQHLAPPKPTSAP